MAKTIFKERCAMLAQTKTCSRRGWNGPGRARESCASMSVNQYSFSLLFIVYYRYLCLLSFCYYCCVCWHPLITYYLDQTQPDPIVTTMTRQGKKHALFGKCEITRLQLLRNSIWAHQGMIVQYLTIITLEGNFLPMAIVDEIVQIPTCICEVDMNSYVNN